MAKPIVADKPIQVSLNNGEEYYFCACGRKQQPFCDGSPAGTEFKPKSPID